MAKTAITVPECVKFHLFRQYVNDNFVGHRVTNAVYRASENDDAVAQRNITNFIKSTTNKSNITYLRAIDARRGRMVFVFDEANSTTGATLFVTRTNKLDWLINTNTSSKVLIEFDSAVAKLPHRCISYFGPISSVEFFLKQPALERFERDKILREESYYIDPIIDDSPNSCYGRLVKYGFMNNENAICYNILKKTVFGVNEEQIKKACVKHNVSSKKQLKDLRREDILLCIKQLLLDCNELYVKFGGRNDLYCAACRRPYHNIVHRGLTDCIDERIDRRYEKFD